MPDNGGYMITAYLLTAMVVCGYVLHLWRSGR